MFSKKFKFIDLLSVNLNKEKALYIFFYLDILIYSTLSLCNFYIFIENGQPDVDDEESGLLGTEVNGEIHIISFLGNFTKL